MTTAVFEKLPEKGVLHMDVRGHTGFAELGKDPVCAGASILAMTAVQCLMMMRDKGLLKKKPRVVVRNGHVEITAKPLETAFSEAEHILWMAQVGMYMLEEAYPGSVKLIPFETARADSI